MLYAPGLHADLEAGVPTAMTAMELEHCDTFFRRYLQRDNAVVTEDMVDDMVSRVAKFR